ncbi:MotA/TolQ/ExbB proton channel family protein [Alcaligenes faecalis]|uniref:MotA/TolQ/ExbB proton channel family protein n=1 Tax=Alcaligenes faecalis TaxID=511 RepID=UPI0034D6DFD8
MLGEHLETVLRTTSATAVTDVFIYIMLILAGLAIFSGARGKNSFLLEHAPTVLVSLGILGTFIGIVIGLLDFNPQDIKNSIEGLLEGLKTAFITSLVGMFLSIALKAMDAILFARLRVQTDSPDAVTPEQIYGVMTQQVRLLEGLNQSLAGNEEGSVAGQLKLFRTDVSDFRNELSRTSREFHDQLFKQLQNFADMLSRSATETIIEALRQVIQDFNKNLVEQFGDNFKLLNESVIKMIEWQEHYKSHVETLEQRIEAAIHELERTATANEVISQSLAKSEESIESIDNHCSSIPVAIGKLEPVLTVNQHQIEELQRHLDVFVTMRESANKAVPELQNHMDLLSKQLAEKIEKVMETMHEGAVEFGSSVDRTNTALTEAASAISNHSENIGTTMRDAATDFSSSTRDVMEKMRSNSAELEQQMSKAIETAAHTMAEEFKRVAGQVHENVSSVITTTMKMLKDSVEGSLTHTETQLQSSANRTLGAVEAQVKEAAGHANDLLRGQLTALDQAISRELEKVFREMGSALATISRRIADDHDELTRRMSTTQ